MNASLESEGRNKKRTNEKLQPQVKILPSSNISSLLRNLTIRICIHFLISKSHTISATYLPPPALNYEPYLVSSTTGSLGQDYVIYTYMLKYLHLDFLMVQWIRICLPKQGTLVQSLVWEDSTYWGAIKPVCHNYWTHVSHLLKPVLHKRSNGKAARHNKE